MQSAKTIKEFKEVDTYIRDEKDKVCQEDKYINRYKIRKNYEEYDI